VDLTCWFMKLSWFWFCFGSCTVVDLVVGVGVDSLELCGVLFLLRWGGGRKARQRGE